MEKSAEKRIVLVPFPLQGHITPIMQLGKALNLKGFSITVVEGESNQVISSQHFPSFQFLTIPETFPVSQHESLGLVGFLMKLNKTSEASFKDYITQLLLQQGNDIACIIYDELMYFSEAAAKEFKLPAVVFSTGSATNHVCGCVLSKLNADKFLINIEDPEVQDMVVENLHPLRYKDLPVSVLIKKKGYIAKWAPQSEVLRHPAVGGFLSHCRWNSTLESIVEGVPMICRPFNGEQKLNAMYIESVWKIGIRLQGEVESEEVERAVKRLIMDNEGAGMRERALVLKGKLKASVRSGGSSYNALDEFVNYLETQQKDV